MERDFRPPVPVPYYELQVPAGNPRAESRLGELMLERAGGYSRGMVHGAWSDPAINQTIREPISVFRFACDSGAYAAILYEAMILYPNESAFFIARIGTATVLDRGEYISRAGMRAAIDANGQEAFVARGFDPDAGGNI